MQTTLNELTGKTKHDQAVQVAPSARDEEMRVKPEIAKAQDAAREPLSAALGSAMKRKLSKQFSTVDKDLKMPDAYAGLRGKLTKGDSAGGGGWGRMSTKHPDAAAAAKG